MYVKRQKWNEERIGKSRVGVAPRKRRIKLLEVRVHRSAIRRTSASLPRQLLLLGSYNFSIGLAEGADDTDFPFDFGPPQNTLCGPTEAGELASIAAAL